MKLAVDKTIMLASGTQDISWHISGDDLPPEVSLVAKYLGIDISIKGRNLIKSREIKMISTATRYA